MNLQGSANIDEDESVESSDFHDTESNQLKSARERKPASPMNELEQSDINIDESEDSISY